VNLSFDLAIAPALGDRRFDRIKVSLDPRNESLQFGDAGSSRFFQPTSETVSRSILEYLTKSLGEALALGNFGVTCRKDGDPRLFLSVSLFWRFREPEGDQLDIRKRSRWGGNSRDWTSAPRLDVFLDAAPLSSIPPLLQFTAKLGGVMAALGRTALQVRAVRVQFRMATARCSLRKLTHPQVSPHCRSRYFQFVGDRALGQAAIVRGGDRIKQSVALLAIYLPDPLMLIWHWSDPGLVNGI
jgi:hypothetical protein